MEFPAIVLDEKELRVLKVIRVEGPTWNRFIGYISYKRFLTKEYNSDTSDYLDDLILNAITNIYENTSLIFNKNIIFKGQYKDIMKGFSGNQNTNFTIRFTPDFSTQDIWKLVGKEFFEYKPKFKFNLSIAPQSNNLQFIGDIGIEYIPFDKLEDFKQRLKSIDFK